MHQRKDEFGEKFLMFFSGPEGLRKLADEADVNRMRDKTRYQWSSLVQAPKPVGYDVPEPAPED